MLSKRNRIVIVTGGYGPERDCSLASGRVVASALAEKGYITSSYVANDWFLPGFPRIADLVFSTVRGRFGSGPLQDQLSRRGIPFSGSSAKTCQLVSDRKRVRNCLRKYGLPALVSGNGRRGATLPEGTIWNAVVLGNRVLPLIADGDGEPGENREREFVSMNETRLRRFALNAFRSVGGFGYGGVRILDSESDGPIVLDIDLAPSFAKGSYLQQALAAAGIQVYEYCERVLEHALLSIPRTLRLAG
ncbi:MAG: hypothetical protein E3J72_16310 [Planctomycetota bacterium]|nr:MAG: hypothetical protein E3J72_16310 [Planctomycetota bacterium]